MVGYHVSMVDTNQAAPAARPLLLHQRLDELTGRIKTRERCREQDNLAIARDLWEISRDRLWQQGGYSGISAYGREAHGYSPGRTSELVSLGRSCELAPNLLEALEQGEISYTLGREVVRGIDPLRPEESAAHWLERARELGHAGRLREEIDGEAPRFRRGFAWSAEELAWVDDAILALEGALGRRLSMNDALPEICRRFLAGVREQGEAPAAASAPPIQVVVSHCPECKQTKRQFSEGELKLSPEFLEQALCDATVVDLTYKGDGVPKRTVPARVRRQVLADYSFRCAVPGCRDRVVQFHHENGWREGHDPATGLPLCERHHRQRHEGYLRLQLEDGAWHFYRADGVKLGKAGDRQKAGAEFSAENSSAATLASAAAAASSTSIRPSASA